MITKSIFQSQDSKYSKTAILKLFADTLDDLSKFKNNEFFILVITLACLAGFHPSQAQQRDTTTLFRVETVDGNEYIGFILSEGNDILRLKTDKLGELNLRKIEIKKISPVDKTHLKEGVYWFENVQSGRYFLSPNGHNLKKGEVYYQNAWVLFNQFNIGVTNHFSLGGGIVPAFLFSGGITPVWVTSKVSIPVKENKFNIGLGGIFGSILGETGSNFGLAYGLTTFGSRDANLTLGAGWGYSWGHWSTTPTFALSGMIRTGQRGYVLTENYYIGGFDNYMILLSAGGRRIIKNVGLDFGLFVPIEKHTDTLIAIPWLGVMVPIGKSKKF